MEKKLPRNPLSRVFQRGFPRKKRFGPNESVFLYGCQRQRQRIHLKFFFLEVFWDSLVSL
jgi:hypothetical protein